MSCIPFLLSRSRYVADRALSGFNKWYKFATDRKSVVIDDFDAMENDLLPFWSMSPEDIRSRTWEITSNPWNEAFGLKVRDGKIELGPNTLPTHRWMMEGVGALIEPFVEHIPDMDLALNVNDESRVAVEWEDLKAMHDLVTTRKPSEHAGADSKWSENRGSQWREILEEPSTDTAFEEASFQHTFHRFAAKTCPPRSEARSERAGNVGRLCASCAAPHSLGPFVADWALAADYCHQPDLANLHGFFLGPAAFKTTKDLLPVFSQSKVHGYNDILYVHSVSCITLAPLSPVVDAAR